MSTPTIYQEWVSFHGSAGPLSPQPPRSRASVPWGPRKGQGCFLRPPLWSRVPTACCLSRKDRGLERVCQADPLSAHLPEQVGTRPASSLVCLRDPGREDPARTSAWNPIPWWSPVVLRSNWTFHVLKLLPRSGSSPACGHRIRLPTVPTPSVWWPRGGCRALGGRQVLSLS